MENTTRIFDSEIIIDESDRWFFRGNEITLITVLNYFKENMDEDENGIFIKNTYGNLSEKGYVTCHGSPLKLIHLESNDSILYFFGDNLKKIPLMELEFSTDSKRRIIAKKNGNKYLYYVLSRDLQTRIADFLEEERGKYFIRFGGCSKEIPEIGGFNEN